MKDKPNNQSSHRGKKKHKFNDLSGISDSNSMNHFEKDQRENAAKRAQRGQSNPQSAINGRGRGGSSRGGSKHVRFGETTSAQTQESFNTPSQFGVKAPNPFQPGSVANSTSTGLVATTKFNPFEAKPAAFMNGFGAHTQSSKDTSVFESQPSTITSVFGAPSQPLTASGVFGAPQVPNSTSVFGAPSSASTPWQKPSGPVFGAPSTSSSSNSNPFATASAPVSGTFTTSTKPQSSFNTSGQNSSNGFTSFAVPATRTLTSSLGKTDGNTTKPLEAPANVLGQSNSNSFAPKINGFPKSSNFTSPFSTKPSTDSAPTSKPSANSLVNKIEQHLRKQRIFPPSWPALDPNIERKFGDPVFAQFRKDYDDYRAKVRESLIKAAYLDDPEKPKRLSEAIDFKGTCEDMCPDYERLTRMMDHRFENAEKKVNPDGSLSKLPVPEKMIKALARSAAGQEAPLPSDVRSAAALRRTTDYLLKDILSQYELPKIHGFLWDRTRAIRRDFVFHSSMSPSELVDQIYCLERITRFHVIALHQMSRKDTGHKFEEQQEVEQLGKSLLSLIHTYEDCKAQGVACENETEFRAYYVLFNSHNPGIIDIVQNWGWKLWKESDDIQIAVALVESLQNVWDTHGPLKPYSAAAIAQNGFSKFFSIVEDKKVSYTMACFAEIFFNAVRKSIFKTILTAYRRQKDQAKDWTVQDLNNYLRFDDEEDIIPFGESYGLSFKVNDNNDEYLCFDSGSSVSDPFPPLKQSHSDGIVERKRGSYSLVEVIDFTVYDESTEDMRDNGNMEGEDEQQQEEELFVKQIDILPNPTNPQTSTEVPSSYSSTITTAPSLMKATLQATQEPESKPKSLFDRVSAPPVFDNNFFSSNTIATPSAAQPNLPKPETSSIFTQPAKKTHSIPSQEPTKHTPSSSVLAQPASILPETIPTLPKAQFSFSPQSETEVQPETKVIPESSTKTLSGFFGANNAVGTQNTEQSSSSLLKLVSSEPVKAHAENSQLGTSPFPPTSSLFNSAPTESSPSGLQEALKNQTMESSVLAPATYPNGQLIPSQELSTTFTATSPPDPSAQYAQLADWVVLGQRGLMEQFTEFYVETLLRKAVRAFEGEERHRQAVEAERLAREQADQFRCRSLATKYGHLWREQAHHLWLKRRGREARKARRELAESMRASKATQSANVVEDFRASTKVRRRDSLDSLLDASVGLHSSSEVQLILHKESSEPAHKRQKSERSTSIETPIKAKHRRGRSENPLRRSLLSDPSYLNGGSRLLMSTYEINNDNQRQVSGVQTDYFRLKARGIATLPGGSPLANSAAKDILHQKHSFDGISKSTTPQQSRQSSVAQSVPSKLVAHSQEVYSSQNGNNDIQALKERARAMIEEDKKSRQKRTFADDEEELFERAKRVREQMDDGATWYRKELERDSQSRSVS